MGASRENYNLFLDIKYKNWNRVKLYPKMFIKNKWVRKCIIEDTVIRPFNRKIGCKTFGHRWSTEVDISKYDLHAPYCWKCGKWSTKQDVREDKIESLLK